MEKIAFDVRKFNLTSLRESQIPNPTTLHALDILQVSLPPNSRCSGSGLAGRATKTFTPFLLSCPATFFRIALFEGRFCNKWRFRTEVFAFELKGDSNQNCSCNTTDRVLTKRRIGTPESTKARKPSKLFQMIRSTRGSHPFTHLPAHWKPRLLKRSWLARGRKAPEH